MKLGSVAALLSIPPDADPLIGRIERAAELGLAVISVGFRENRDPGYMARVADAARQRGIELLLGGGGRFGSADPKERQADVVETIDYLLAVNRHTGITFSSLANGPMSHNRWSPEPPLDERIDMIAENLATIGDAVASAGITVGLENHCDYRGYECAAMLRKANRPNVKAQLDTGNAFTVFEEPVDCARALAPWTVSVHLKDVKVTPLAPAPWRGSRAESVPLGGGQVENVTICRILREAGPEAEHLALLIEPLALGPDDDRDAFLAASLTWARGHLAAFLT